MTVCIAAFAERSKAIVLASDKAVTIGSRVPMESDTSVRKILPIGHSGWNALIAGDGSFAQKVIFHARQSFREKTSRTSRPTKSSKNESFTSVMEQMKKSYQEVRRETVKSEVLGPLLIDDELLVARKRELLPLPDTIVELAVKGLVKYHSSCEMLICGFGSDKRPHIFSLSEPGARLTIHDLSGNWAIGIGAAAAMERLLWVEMDRRESLDRVLYQVFAAKANAEIVQGVGYEWDAEIMIFGKKSKRVPRDIKNLIAKVFEESTVSPFEKRKVPPKWKEKLSAFTRSVLSD